MNTKPLCLLALAASALAVGAQAETFAIAIGDTVSDGFVNDTPTPGAGNLATVGEVDVYTFSGTAGQRVYFNGNAPDTSHNYRECGLASI